MSKRNGLYICLDGTRRWYLNDRYHRIDGPAIEYESGGNRWIKYGIYHRIGGPAIECDDGEREWWLYNKEYKESEYNHLVSNLPLLYWNRFKRGKWI